MSKRMLPNFIVGSFLLKRFLQFLCMYDGSAKTHKNVLSTGLFSRNSFLLMELNLLSCPNGRCERSNY